MLREATPEDVAEILRIRAFVRENRLDSRTIPDSEVVTAITESGKGWVIETEAGVVAFGIADGVARSHDGPIARPDELEGSFRG